MKKIIIAVTIIFIIILLIFIWLLNRGTSTEESSIVSIENETSGGSSFFPGRRSTPSSTSSSLSISPTPAGKATINAPKNSYKYSLLEKLNNSLPFSSRDFDLVYSPELKKYLLTKKTNNADAAIRAWAMQNDLLGLFSTVNGTSAYSDIFLIRDTSATISTSNTPYKNPVIKQLPQSKQQTLNTVKTTPQKTKDYAVDYLKDYDTYVVERKNASSFNQVKQWAEQNNLADIIENESIFVHTGGTAELLDEEIKGTLSQVQPTQTADNAYQDTLQTMIDFFSYLPKAEPSSTPSTNGNPEEPSLPSTGTIDSNVLGIIDSYGLPPPTADFFNGANGYNDLRNKLSGTKASWAAKELLNAEKLYESKNPTSAGLPKVNRYLTTAWIWFENGASAWPDPYQINCNDDRSGYISEAHFFCNVNNFQVAGYQAASRRGDYARIFTLLYPENQLQQRMQQVLSNDSNAARDKWKYSSSAQQKGLVASYKNAISSATIGDISPNRPFTDQRTQFLSLVLGKDPGMVIGLNTFAVSDGDLIRGIKTQSCVYGYICQTEKQLLSNMIAALYLIDTGGTYIPPIEETGEIVADSPKSQQIKQIVQEIKSACTNLGSGRVTSRNVSCLNNVRSLTPKARDLMKFSAQRYADLQCVGFVVGMIAQTTGQDISGKGNAIDYSTNIARSYRFHRKEVAAPQIDDIVIWYSDTYGHIAVVTHVYNNNLIEVAEANYKPGTVGIRQVPVKGSSIKGWLRKI